MDWFLYDNGLRHERLKLMENVNETIVSTVSHGLPFEFTICVK